MAEDQQERQTDLWSAYAAEGISSTSLSDRDQEIRELRQQVQDLTGVLKAICLTQRQLPEREVQSDWFSQHWKSWQDGWWHDEEWTKTPAVGSWWDDAKSSWNSWQDSMGCSFHLSFSKVGCFKSDVWLDDVKKFYLRPMRCVIVVHPYPMANTTLLTESAFLSCAKTCVDGSRFSPDLHNNKRVTLNKRQKNEISNSVPFITETDQIMWNLLTNTMPHGRTIMYMVTPVTQTSMMAVGHFAQIFDPGKNKQQLTEDFVTKFQNEFATDDPNVVFSFVPFSGR